MSILNQVPLGVRVHIPPSSGLYAPAATCVPSLSNPERSTLTTRRLEQ